MKTIFRIGIILFCLCLFTACGRRNEAPEPTPVPSEGFVRQSYDIQGLVVEDGEARVYGLVLNTGTMDIAYIGFTVELLDASNAVLYEQRYESTLHAALVPGDSFPFNCVFPKIYDEDADFIAKVRIDKLVWRP